MIYGYTSKSTLADMHTQAKLLRSKITNLTFSLASHQCVDSAMSNLKNDGITTIKNIYKTQTIEAVRNAALHAIDNKKISRVRNRAAESKSDIANGSFRFFTPDELRSQDFILQERANVVSVLDPFENIPDLYKLVFEKQLLAYAAKYFGSIPLVSFVKLTMSFCNSLPDSDTQFWHVDFGAKKILKAIVYLHDVGPFEGAFCYIKGSHHKKFKGWNLQSRYETEQMKKIYNHDCLYPATANSGDCVLAETSGFHKGERPIEKSRLCLIFNFTLHPEVGFPWNKINMPRSVYDKLCSDQQHFVSHDIFNIT